MCTEERHGVRQQLEPVVVSALVKVLQQYSSDLLRGLEPSNPDQSRYPALLARNLHKNESGFLLC